MLNSMVKQVQWPPLWVLRIASILSVYSPNGFLQALRHLAGCCSWHDRLHQGFQRRVLVRFGLDMPCSRVIIAFGIALNISSRGLHNRPTNMQ